MGSVSFLRLQPQLYKPADGLGLFCSGGARPPVQAMIAFIDDHRAVSWGSSRSARCCRSPHRPTTPMRPSDADPDRSCRRAPGCDAALADRGSRVCDRQLLRLRRPQGLAPAAARRLRRCPLHVSQTDATHGLQGVARGKPVKTTMQRPGLAVPAGSRPPPVLCADRPNALWLSDFT